MTASKFDFVIAGAGAAGLSLLVRMIKSGRFSNHSILLVDKEAKTANDRTWCFWEDGTGFFEEIVYRSWPEIAIHGEALSKRIDILPYQYKMIRGIDFYNYCFEIINRQPNITTQYGDVSALSSDDTTASILIGNEKIEGGLIFNSIRLGSNITALGKYNLLQHFTGWTIETDQPIFDQDLATLMDFRLPQQNGCRFVYVMPFSPHSALVEFTVFGKKLLSEDEYGDVLNGYLEERYPGIPYRIAGTEFGVIPMTDFSFPPDEARIIHIGTAGGQTKPSSGYTFQFIQKKTAEIVALLAEDSKALKLSKTPARFRFYDKVLLNVLATGKQRGADVFTRLFDKNPSSRIFRFLDNESSFNEEIALISTLPTLPFLSASFE